MAVHDRQRKAEWGITRLVGMTLTHVNNIVLVKGQKFEYTPRGPIPYHTLIPNITKHKKYTQAGHVSAICEQHINPQEN